MIFMRQLSDRWRSITCLSEIAWKITCNDLYAANRPHGKATFTKKKTHLYHFPAMQLNCVNVGQSNSSMTRWKTTNVASILGLKL